MTEIFEERREHSESEGQALIESIKSSASDHSRNTRADLVELAVVAEERGLDEEFKKGLVDTIVSLKITSPNGINKRIGQGE